MLDADRFAGGVTLVGAAVATWGTSMPWLRSPAGTLGQVIPLVEVYGFTVPAMKGSGFTMPWALALLPAAITVVLVLGRADPRRRAITGGFASVVLLAVLALGLAQGPFRPTTAGDPTVGAFVTFLGAYVLLTGSALTASAHDVTPNGHDRFGRPLDAE